MTVACGNITGMIRVVLDEEDHLKYYALLSPACAEGEPPKPLLQDYLRGQSVEAIGGCSLQDVLDNGALREACSESEAEDHLCAVQAVLAVLTGHAPCGPAAPCSAAEVSCADGETIITARLGKDTPQSARKDCDRCRTSGRRGRR